MNHLNLFPQTFPPIKSAARAWLRENVESVFMEGSSSKTKASTNKVYGDKGDMVNIIAEHGDVLILQKCEPPHQTFPAKRSQVILKEVV